jgi:hypothetical protein
MRGVAGGFMQANHGKEAPLKRMKPGDKVLFYSPKQSFDGDEKCQSFTAIGEVADDEIYQYKMAENFTPYRRNVTFYDCKELPILPIINDLDFIENKKSWGYRFRFGFFEINEKDFMFINAKMLADNGKSI